MATQILFVPGATTSNVSLPVWAPDIASMPTTTVTGWELLKETTGGTVKTRATTFTARTFNAKVTVGSKDRNVIVVYNAVDELVRT